MSKVIEKIHKFLKVNNEIGLIIQSFIFLILILFILSWLISGGVNEITKLHKLKDDINNYNLTGSPVNDYTFIFNAQIEYNNDPNYKYKIEHLRKEFIKKYGNERYNIYHENIYKEVKNAR